MPTSPVIQSYHNPILIVQLCLKSVVLSTLWYHASIPGKTMCCIILWWRIKPSSCVYDPVCFLSNFGHRTIQKGLETTNSKTWRVKFLKKLSCFIGTGEEVKCKNLVSNRLIRGVYIIDPAWGQDGWILAEFAFCEVEVHKNVKREWVQYPAILTELAWSIKDLLYGIKSTEKKNDLCTCLFSSTEKEPS